MAVRRSRGRQARRRGSVARDTRDLRQPLERHAGFCFNNRWGRRLQRRIHDGKVVLVQGAYYPAITEHQNGGGGAASAGSMPPSASSLGAAGPARSRAGTSGCTGWFEGPAPCRWLRRRFWRRWFQPPRRKRRRSRTRCSKRRPRPSMQRRRRNRDIGTRGMVPFLTFSLFSLSSRRSCSRRRAC